jgi:hypothetical protein
VDAVSHGVRFELGQMLHVREGWEGDGYGRSSIFEAIVVATHGCIACTAVYAIINGANIIIIILWIGNILWKGVGNVCHLIVWYVRMSIVMMVLLRWKSVGNVRGLVEWCISIVLIVLWHWKGVGNVQRIV